MSSSDRVEAMPRMMGLLRLPALNSVSCLNRYSGCWPWMIGFAGLPREPSLAWQATHTPLEMASPLARSGLAAAGASAARAAAHSGTIDTLDSSKENRAKGFMWREISDSKHYRA